MSRQILTVTEASLVSGVARSTIFLAIRDGKLAATKLSGRRRRIRVCDLSVWLGHEIVMPSVQS
jgi:excisionase family DNA binding protein